MEFWFCEKCGVRVTATQLANGAVRNPDTGVVFCLKCSSAAAPVDASPAPIPSPVPAPAVMVSQSKAHATPAVGNAPPAAATARLVGARGTAIRSRETTILRKRETSSGRPTPERQSSGERPAVPLAKKNMPLLLGIAGAVVLMALVALFLSLGGTPEKKTGDTGTKPPADKPEKKDSDNLASKEPIPPPKSSDRIEKPPEEKAAAAVPSPRDIAKLEAEAQDAFGVLENKIKTLPDLTSQTAAIEAFLAKYDNCIVGARARSLKSKLKEPQTAQNKQPAPVPDPAKAPPPAPAQAAAATPEELQAIVEKATALAAKQDYAGAIGVYDKAIAANPNLFQFYQNRANMKLIAGDFEGVIADCDKAISIQPDWGSYGMKTIAAYVLKRDGEYHATLEKAAALKNVTPKVLEQSLAAEFQRGLWVLEGKPFETKAPAQPLEFWARGRYRMAFAKTAEANADMHEALKRDATLGPKGLYLELANLARAQKDFKETLNCLKQWAEAKPETAQGLNAYAWELLTCADTALRDPKTALTNAEKAAELTQKKDAAVLDTLAIAYFYNTRIRTAISTEEKAIELLPADTAPEVKKEYEKHLSEFKAMEGKDGTY